MEHQQQFAEQLCEELNNRIFNDWKLNNYIFYYDITTNYKYHVIIYKENNPRFTSVYLYYSSDTKPVVTVNQLNHSIEQILNMIVDKIEQIEPPSLIFK